MTLQKELKQNRPFGSVSEELAVSLYATAEKLKQYHDEVLKSLGISMPQYNILRIARGAGKEGRTCTEIADRMISKDPDITRLVDNLVKKGLVSRERDSRDRRVVRTYITDMGLKLLDDLKKPLEKKSKTALNIPENNARQMLKWLETIREGMA